MVSRDGFKTWLDYEFLFIKLAVIGGGLLWIGYLLSSWIRQFEVSVSGILAAWGVFIVVSAGLVWWIGQTSQ